jgi:glycosyltransferase involved in cell wall biosynthesis
VKIALLGTRGVPASYSGFETCVEQLGQRLVERGHEVVVYCRPHHVEDVGRTYKGMRLVKPPALPNKYLETIGHSFLSTLHLLYERADVGLYFIAGNSPVTWIPRLFGIRTVLNVDGLDWKRDKWPEAAKRYIQLAERLATVLPTAYLTDSRVVQDYYQQTYGSRPPFIPYGSELQRRPPGETLARFGLTAGRYALFVGRLVPENAAHHLVEAFARFPDPDMKCVIVGDAPYAEEYQRSLRALAARDPRVVLTGYVFGAGYQELGSNAWAFVETSGVGGTHPALVEAMAFGNCVVVNGTPANRETVGDTGLAYDGEQGGAALAVVLQRLAADPDFVATARRRAQERAAAAYSWETVTSLYERLLLRVCGRPLPERLQQVPGDDEAADR